MSVRSIKFACASLFASSVMLLFTPKIALGSFPSPNGGNASLPQQYRDVHDELDPKDPESCYAMGELDITYSSERKGPPVIGLVVTDPRGRRIGHDPIANRNLQELPLAQAYIDCLERDDNGDLGSCTGTIQICGPVSGSYKVQVKAADTGRYSVNVSATSQEVLMKKEFRATDSRTGVQEVPIRKHSQDALVVRYSREPGTRVDLLRSKDNENASSKPQLLNQNVQ
jgi:hypothetical protein